MRIFILSSLSGLVLLLFSLIVSGCANSTLPKGDTLEKVQQRGVLVVGSSYSAPPQAFLNKKGQPDGLDVELAGLIAKELLGDTSKVKFVDLPNPSRLSAVNSGQVDLILGSFSHTKAREQYYDFSKPYMVSRFRVIVKKDSGITSTKELGGKTVTFIFGGTSEGILKKTLPTSAQLMGYNSLADEARAFSLGQVDAFANQEGALLSYMKKSCGTMMLPEVLDEARYVIGFSKNPEVDTFENKIQNILTKFETDGTIEKLKTKWLTIPDYIPCRS